MKFPILDNVYPARCALYSLNQTFGQLFGLLQCLLRPLALGDVDKAAYRCSLSFVLDGKDLFRDPHRFPSLPHKPERIRCGAPTLQISYCSRSNYLPVLRVDVIEGISPYKLTTLVARYLFKQRADPLEPPRLDDVYYGSAALHHATKDSFPTARSLLRPLALFFYLFQLSNSLAEFHQFIYELLFCPIFVIHRVYH